MHPAWVLGSLLVTAAIVAPTAAADDWDFYLVADDATTAYGDSAVLRAQLWDPDGFNCPCPEPGRQVDFYVDGVYVGTDVTNSGGFAYLVVGSPDWHVGTHVITAKYDDYVSPGTPSQDDAVLTIVQETTVLEARDGYLEARLTDNEGNALEGFPIRFSATSPLGIHDLCIAFTGSDGVARCSGQVGAGITPADGVAYNADYDGSLDHAASADTGNLA